MNKFAVEEKDTSRLDDDLADSDDTDADELVHSDDIDADELADSDGTDSEAHFVDPNGEYFLSKIEGV